MARYWTMVIGLSLSMAALGCGDEEVVDGTGGTGGMGGSGGMAGTGGTGGAVAMDACINSGDLAMVCMPDFGTTYVSPCATTALGDGAATSACLQEDPPALSAPCADCFGDTTACTLTNCVVGGGGACAPPNASDSPDCVACREEAGCVATQETCIGDLATACAG
ncbi:MAG: hypothetical protein WBM46_02575 [Polyangiales bacterium]